MNIKIKESTPTRRTVTVTVPAADVAASETAVLKQFAKEARLPGFRPGKAPEAMVRSRYAADITKETRQRILSEGYDKVRADERVKVYSLVSANQDDTAEGKDAVLHFEIDVLPEFATPKWRTIKVEAKMDPVTDTDVQTQIDQIRAQRATFEKTESAAAKAVVGGKDVIHPEGLALLEAAADERECHGFLRERCNGPGHRVDWPRRAAQRPRQPRGGRVPHLPVMYPAVPGA